VDVGCGAGKFAAEFLRQGVRKVVAVDGSYVDPGKLMIDRAHFVARDLERPLDLEGTFDLAVSLEVAEHLTKERAAGFVADLVSLAPVVLFSAAVPGQGGTNHINEQWQGYWLDLFAARGYRAVDCIRPRIWKDRRVEVWYRQNIIMYVSESRYEAYAHLNSGGPPDVVHPELFTRCSGQLEEARRGPTLGALLRSIPGIVGRSFKSRVLGQKP